jgi:alkanesulfonate monooxygenase SsuD/methylene tetrahydromethanopterin reductase-like flavin-dependent oxidoreductase (luciferase family)
MKSGLALPNAGVEAGTLVEFAVLAEEAGWEGVFLEDYIVWQGHQETPTYDPWALLAAMAVRTRRVRLGTMVTPLARRRPWKVAAECVTIDHLSGGRMTLGVGLGDVVTGDVSFDHFGEESDPKRRARMLDEALEIITGLWLGEPLSFTGEHYQVQETTVLPRPVQSPRIPIWVGGGYPNKGPLRRAARWDGACLYKQDVHFMQPEDVRALKDYVAGERAAAGIPETVPYQIVEGGSPRRDDWDQERAYIRALAEAGMTWWIEYVPPGDLEWMRSCVSREPLRIEDL